MNAQMMLVAPTDDPVRISGHASDQRTSSLTGIATLRWAYK
jgi:hypothetical protein